MPHAVVDASAHMWPLSGYVTFTPVQCSSLIWGTLNVMNITNSYFYLPRLLDIESCHFNLIIVALLRLSKFEV